MMTAMRDRKTWELGMHCQVFILLSTLLSAAVLPPFMSESECTSVFAVSLELQGRRLMVTPHRTCETENRRQPCI
jgi:hypothetical protein